MINIKNEINLKNIINARNSIHFFFKLSKVFKEFKIGNLRSRKIQNEKVVQIFGLLYCGQGHFLHEHGRYLTLKNFP